MSNMLNPKKRRVSYAEWSDVFVVIQQIAKRERKTVADVLRETMFARANTELQRLGRTPLNSENR